MDTFQMNPKAICVEMAFHHPHDMQAFYRMHRVRKQIGSTIFQAKKGKLRRLLDNVHLEELPDSREHLFYGSLAKDKQMSGKCCQTILGLLVAAPIYLSTKKAEIFTPQLVQDFWYKLKTKSPKIVVMSPTAICAWPWQNTKSLAENTSLFWDQKQEEFGEKVPLPMDFPAWKNPKWIFHNLGNLLRPLESILIPRERVVPTEWHVRKNTWRLYIRGKGNTVQAPQHRQHA